MKVNIGPYVSWIGPYQIADTVFFWVNKKGYRPENDPFWERWDVKASEKLGEWLSKTWVNNFCNWLGEKKKRKVKVKIDDYDVWSADHTIALVVYPLLVKLKEVKHGSPITDPEDAPHIGKGDELDYGHSDTRMHERWEWILDEIIWTFNELANDQPNAPPFPKRFTAENDVDWNRPYTEEEQKEYNEYSSKNKIYEERIRNSLKLFGKYYQALWD